MMMLGKHLQAVELVLLRQTGVCDDTAKNCYETLLGTIEVKLYFFYL
jgi:hypothetical protein